MDGGAVDVINDDLIHLLKQLHAALHLFGLGGFIAKTLNESFDVLNLALLVLVGRALHVDTLFTQADIVRIRHLIVVYLAIADFHRPEGEVVQESAVVRDHQDGAIIGLQKAFEPLDGLDVEVVGRFVEKKQIGLFQQDFGQFYAHLPAVAELAHGALHIFVPETQSNQNPFRLAFDGVAAKQGQTVVQIVHPNDEFLILRAFVIGAFGQFLLHLFQVALQLVIFVESGKRLIQNRLCTIYILLLRQIADGNALWDDDIAL